MQNKFVCLQCESITGRIREEFFGLHRKGSERFDTAGLQIQGSFGKIKRGQMPRQESQSKEVPVRAIAQYEIGAGLAIKNTPGKKI